MSAKIVTAFVLAAGERRFDHRCSTIKPCGRVCPLLRELVELLAATSVLSAQGYKKACSLSQLRRGGHTPWEANDTNEEVMAEDEAESQGSRPFGVCLDRGGARLRAIRSETKRMYNTAKTPQLAEASIARPTPAARQHLNEPFFNSVRCAWI